MKAVTLLYHDVICNGDYTTSGFSGGDADFYKLDINEFQKHISTLVDKNKCKAEDLSRLLDTNRNDNSTAFYVTFDDGGSSFLKPIADILEQNGWIGIFFISTDYIGTPGFMTKEEIQELHKRGHIIGSHSCSHPKRITDCTYDEMLMEWGESRSVLEEIIGTEVISASVPGGFLSSEIEKSAAESGYKALFTSEPQKSIYKVDDCLILGRYSLVQGMSADKAVALGKKSFSVEQLFQYLYWNFKKFLKTYFTGFYRALRLRLLNMK